jgi:hypothetical protein
MFATAARLVVIILRVLQLGVEEEDANLNPHCDVQIRLVVYN